MNIILAGSDELEDVVPLFDAYRQFYAQDSDKQLARDYLRARLERNEHTLFAAYTDDGQAVGFTQLYHSYCSVTATPIVILYDVFVSASVRGQGVGKLLMDRALDHAREIGASRIDLETAIDNVTAQRLYEWLGYKRDVEFYKYSLEVSAQD